MSPERPDFILTTDIPDCKADVLVFNSLNIEPFSISQSYNEHNICINGGRGMITYRLDYITAIYKTWTIRQNRVFTETERFNIYIISPIVGIVVTISPSFSLYKMVVFPAASRPTKI